VSISQCSLTRLAYRLEVIYRGPGLDGALLGNGVMGQSQDLRASKAVNHIGLLRPALLAYCYFYIEAIESLIFVLSI
jgi:hypothetical protein